VITTPQRRENRLVRRLARPELRCAAVRVNIPANPAVVGGEGVITPFTGSGRPWRQTRSQDDLVYWLIPRLASSGSES
jgi:uncharacterized protein (AIM24 family)